MKQVERRTLRKLQDYFWKTGIRKIPIHDAFKITCSDLNVKKGCAKQIFRELEKTGKLEFIGFHSLNLSDYGEPSFLSKTTKKEPKIAEKIIEKEAKNEEKDEFNIGELKNLNLTNAKELIFICSVMKFIRESDSEKLKENLPKLREALDYWLRDAQGLNSQASTL